MKPDRWHAGSAAPHLKLGLICLAGIFGLIRANGATLLWDPNTETNIAGYRVYIGKASRAYETNINVGNTTNWPIAGLPDGVPHFFAVTAYDDQGLESDVSEEVSYTPGQTNAVSVSLTMVGIDSQGCAMLLARGTPTRIYRLEASADFITWTPVQVFVATQTDVVVKDCPGEEPCRFYRMQRIFD